MSNGEQYDPMDTREDERADTCPGAVLTRLAARHGLTCEAVADIAAELEETGVAHAGGAESVALDKLRALELRERKAWHLLVRQLCDLSTLGDGIVAARTMALVLGHETAAGAATIADLARKAGALKQTVNKCAVLFEEGLSLPPRFGQRSAAARESMRAARRRQLRARTQNP